MGEDPATKSKGGEPTAKSDEPIAEGGESALGPSLSASPKPVAAGESQALPRCPYCHSPIKVQGRVWVACEACLARHHRACWRDNGACGTCKGSLGLSPVRQRPRVSQQRWFMRAGRKDLLVAASGAMILTVLAASMAYGMGRQRERRDQEDPRIVRAEAIAERDLALQVCRVALTESGREELSRKLAAFHDRTQPYRIFLLNDLAALLKDLDPADPNDAALKKTLDAHLPRALMDVYELKRQ